VKAVFQQVTKEEFEKRMESIGLPNNLAVAVGELCSGLPYGEAELEANDKIKAREVSSIRRIDQKPDTNRNLDNSFIL
jgi:hypothetical protein